MGLDGIINGLRAKVMLKGPEHVLGSQIRPVMELHTLSYSKSPRQTIGRGTPIAGYTWHQLSCLVGGNDMPAKNSTKVDPPRPTLENVVKTLGTQIPHHNGQNAGIDHRHLGAGSSLRRRNGRRSSSGAGPWHGASRWGCSRGRSTAGHSQQCQRHDQNYQRYFRWGPFKMRHANRPLHPEFPDVYDPSTATRMTTAKTGAPEAARPGIDTYPGWVLTPYPVVLPLRS